MADRDDHPSNFLRLSNSEPDLTLQLSLAGSAGAFITPAVGGSGQLAPMPLINGATAGDQKGKAIVMINQLPAAAATATKKRPFAVTGRTSWKKRARELGNGGHLLISPATPQQLLMPPPAPRLPRAASDSAQHNSAFRRAVSVIKSGIDRRRASASHNSTTVMAAPPKEIMMRSHHHHPDHHSSTAMQSRMKLMVSERKPIHHHELDAPIRTAVPACSNHHMVKPAIMYGGGGQSSYGGGQYLQVGRTGSPSRKPNMKVVSPSSKNNYLLKSAIINNYAQYSSRDQVVQVGRPSPSSSKKKGQEEEEAEAPYNNNNNNNNNNNKHVSFGGAMGEDEIERIIKIMPSVTTTGGLANGRKIEGVLFKYLEGKVWIVCVCHGNLLSPEDFVRHAGGSDLTNAMRLIKVVRS